MPNVELEPYSRPSMWRRMALAVWRAPADSQVYGRLEVEMTAALEYARQESNRSGQKVGPMHLVARALALGLRRYPDANALVRRNRVYRRKRVGIFFQVAVPGRNADLAGVVVHDADTKTAEQIAEELQAQARQIKRGSDTQTTPARRFLDLAPGFLYRPLLLWLDFLQYTLNLTPRVFGIPQDCFGSAMITSLASLGLSEGFAPLVPRTRVPLILSVGKVEDRPVVRDGAIVIRPICVLCATFDHRVMDGLVAGRLARFMTQYLGDPAKYEGFCADGGPQ